nr:alpha/beta hydrolase [Streptomyces sp. RKND-216]
MRRTGDGCPLYTRDAVPALRRNATPKLLVWGEDDRSQRVEYAERFASETLHSTLVRVPDAGHIPTENAPDRIARAPTGFSESTAGQGPFGRSPRRGRDLSG